jgi:hypothetical protein
MKKQRLSLKSDQRGIASIIISIFVILILSLIVLDMSRDSNREQRQALDRQLSSQAFYAAESGINDAVRYINQADDPFPEKEDCEPWQGNNQIPGFSSVLSDTLSYTCVMFDTNLTDLEYQNVSTSSSQIVPVEVESGTLDTLEISWKATGNSVPDERANNRSFSACPSGTFYNTSETRFPRATQYPGNCDAGFLRIEVADSRGGLNRSNLINNGLVIFAVPKNGGSINSVSMGDSSLKGNNTGIVREAQCTGGPDGKCRIRITNANLNAGEQIYLRISPIYKSANFYINGELAGGPAGEIEEALFVNAQIIVDATGKATDVLKRLQVRVPLGVNATQESEFRFPEFPIHADNICKQLQVLPPGTGTTVSGCD